MGPNTIKSLICQAYFKEHLLPRIEATMGEKADAHTLFNLTRAHNGQLPVKMYTELEINFFGLSVPNVFLISGEPNSVLDRKHNTKLPGIIGWNLVWLAYKFLWKNMGEKCLTALKVGKELIYSCYFSSVYIIMLKYLKSIIWECGLFATRLVVTFSLPLANWLTWLKEVTRGNMSQYRGRLGTPWSVPASLHWHQQGMVVLVVGYSSLCS